ncbi:2'-5' RNA ligase family protein [Nocardioides sp. P5_C9_2]
MPRLHAFELLPDDEGRDAVLRDWQLLRDAGLPSQLDHKGMTNTPHVTVLTAEALGTEHDEVAVSRLGAALPVEVRASGLALLGGSRVSLVRILDVPDSLVRAVLDLRTDVPHAKHPGWLPHVTLARRLTRSALPAALEVLGHGDLTLRLTELRRWDPDAGTVRTL